MTKSVSTTWPQNNPLDYGPGRQIVEDNLDDLLPRNHRTWTRSGIIGQALVFDPARVTGATLQIPGAQWVFEPHVETAAGQRQVVFDAFLERTTVTIHLINLSTYAAITGTINRASSTLGWQSATFTLNANIPYFAYCTDETNDVAGRLLMLGPRETIKTAGDLP